MSLKKLIFVLQKTFHDVKDILTFLLISMVIIEGWRLLGLDAVFSPIFSQLFRWLMFVEFQIATALLKPFVSFEQDHARLLLTFPGNISVYLYEGCSGLKQIMQFTLIMLIYPGPWLRKSWFIPLSWLNLLAAAIIHFIFLCFVLITIPQYYQFMHDHISRWFFFFIFFLLWVWFTRHASGKPDKKLKSDIQAQTE